MDRRRFGKRVGLAIAVAALVTITAFAMPVLFTGDRTPTERVDHPEFDAGSLAVDPLDTDGSIDPDADPAASSGVVVIDTAHSNDVDRADIAPLVEGLTAANHSVRYHGTGDNLTKQLDGAKAFVVITPYLGFDEEELDTIENATDDGMHLLLVAEPDWITVSRGPFGEAIPTEKQSRIAPIASAHGVSFDTRYLYDLQTNDVNYKHVLAEPASKEELSDIERVSAYTATRVTARNGTPLLVTPASTRLSDGGQLGPHRIAVRQGNTVALGDRTMLHADRATVADNEHFVEYLVEFLVAGEEPDLIGEPADGGDTTDGGENETEQEPVPA